MYFPKILISLANQITILRPPHLNVIRIYLLTLYFYTSVVKIIPFYIIWFNIIRWLRIMEGQEKNSFD